MISVKPNFKDVKRMLLDSREDVEKATVSALNKTARQSKTAASKEIRKIYMVKAAPLNRKLSIELAHRQKKYSKVIGSDQGMSLKHFGAQRQVKKGVSVKISRSQKRSIIKSAFGPDIARLGHTAFKRTGPARLPIKKLLSVGPAMMLRKRPVVKAVLKYAEENFKRILNHELKYFKSK